MKNKIFVIDTNILISSSLFKNSSPRKAETKANETGKIATSIATYSEFFEVFLRSKFDKYISKETRLKILMDFKQVAIFSEISETITDCRDAKDNKFLELGVAANASCIITGDKDLLVMNPFREIPILTPADFLNIF